MEHPLQVEEFLPGAAPPVRAEALNLQPPRPGAAEAAPAAPLPPPPDLLQAMSSISDPAIRNTPLIFRQPTNARS